MIFRADNIGKALEVIRNMFVWNGSGLNAGPVLLQMSSWFVVMILIAVVGSVPVFKRIHMPKPVSNCLYLLLMFISVTYLAGLSYNPFIYFKF